MSHTEAPQKTLEELRAEHAVAAPTISPDPDTPPRSGDAERVKAKIKGARKLGDISGLTREIITELLLKNDRAVERALVILFERQTLDEQASRTTKWANGRGFGAYDAEIFSSFARQILKGWTLSQKQLACCRKKSTRGSVRIARYWRQLIEAADVKAAARMTN